MIPFQKKLAYTRNAFAVPIVLLILLAISIHMAWVSLDDVLVQYTVRALVFVTAALWALYGYLQHSMGYVDLPQALGPVRRHTHPKAFWFIYAVGYCLLPAMTMVAMLYA